VATNAPLEVRLRATDDAGNVGEGAANVTPSGGGSGAVGVTPPGGGAETPPPSGPAKRQFTNSREVKLKYNLEDVGVSGVSVVEVWSTPDGKSWQLLKPETNIPKGGDKPLSVRLEFKTEGLFGFTLIPRSGVGRGD